MCELSAADGFVEINDSLGDMIKYVANEPSVGLYYIQQHAQNAVPNVIRLKNNITDKSHEVSLHTEDLEDSIAVTRSMKECGFPIIDEMIGDIKTSLSIMSTKQPLRGVIPKRNLSYNIGGSSSWAPVTWARSAVSVQNDDSERGGSYFSSVLKSAKERAGSLKWPQLDLIGGDLVAPRSNSSTQADEADELPVSSQVEDDTVKDDNAPTDENPELVLPGSNEYDEFKANREARLEEWLKSSGGVSQKGTGDSEVDHMFDNNL